jgi:hypothetical protein
MDWIENQQTRERAVNFLWGLPNFHILNLYIVSKNRAGTLKFQDPPISWPRTVFSSILTNI